MRCQTFSFLFSFPCSADHEQRDWPPCTTYKRFDIFFPLTEGDAQKVLHRCVQTSFVFKVLFLGSCTSKKNLNASTGRPYEHSPVLLLLCPKKEKEKKKAFMFLGKCLGRYRFSRVHNKFCIIAVFKEKSECT